MTETLRQRLEADLKTAIKGGDVVGRDTIRFLLSGLKNAEIEKRNGLDEEEATALLLRQTKRMKESIEQFQAGGRQDLVDKEAAQLAIVKRYLPAELTDEELNRLAREVIAETGAMGPKDMARVMPLVLERVAKRADGKRVSNVVKAALSSSQPGSA